MQRKVSMLRNRSILDAAILVTVLMLAQSLAAQGATYYVSTSGNDNNPGTMAVPFRTISKAATVATAGATVYVMGGVYNEFVTLANSGTVGSPITFQSYPGQTAIIDGTGLTVSGTKGLITISGTRSYITVSGFEIRNLSSSSGVPCGVWITGSGTGVQIRNNLIHNIVNTKGTGNGCGLFAYGTSQTPISGLVVNGNELYNLKTGESESMTLNGNVTNFQVTNNLVHDNSNIGIDIIGYEGTGPVGYDEASYGVVSGNTIYNISGIANTGEGSSYDADGLYCDGCAFVTFEKNVVFQVDYGIETTSEDQVCQITGTEWPGADGVGTPAKGKLPCYGRYATVRNNLFYYENACGNSIGGYALATAKGGGSNGGGSSLNDVFVNNTLFDNGTQPGNASVGTPSGDFQTQYQLGSAQGDIYENNLIYESAASPYSTSPNMWINGLVPTTQVYPSGLTYTGAPATLNWNLYGSVAGYVQGTSILWTDINTYTSFSNYQSTTGEDANSINADPLLVNVGDTPPNLGTTPSSPAIGGGSTSLACSVGWCDPNGTSPSSIYGSTDFLGNPRTSGSSIDIGAFQNTGSAVSNSLVVNLTAATYTLQPNQTTTLTATVTAIPGVGGVPSGTVNYMLGGNLLATQTLLPTSATTSAASMPISASQLAQGDNTLTAVYSGNSIAPCCTPSQPPGGSQTPVPWYPSANSAPFVITFSGSPGIYSPVSSSALTSAPAVFQWFGYPGATAYWLDLGKEQGGNEYYSSGSLSSSTTSQTVGSLPADGSTVWARWYYLLSGSWQSTDYSYTAMGGSASKGAITSPAPSSTLTGASATFTWTPGTGATAYWINVGSSVGGSQYYSSGNVGNTVSTTVSGLPTNGAPLNVTLYSMVGGQWFGNAYTYTAFTSTATAGVITSPAPNSTLAGSSATFVWSAGSGATAYWIDAGSTAGGHDYYSSGNLGNVLTKAISGLPINGSTVYVTLYSLASGSWLSNAYTYTAYNLAAAGGVLTTPNPGSTLTSGTVTFGWSLGGGASAYWVDVGSTPGSHNYYSSGSLGNVSSTTVSGLPTDGSTIYVTLYSLIGSTWSGNSYNYTALNATSGLSTIQTPAPNTTLSGSTATFTWNSDASATAYWMDIGTSAGGNTVYSSGTLGLSLNTTVYSLPANGSTIYVTLYSYVGGQWLSTSASYVSGP
jgi:Protein of unknown function (DUF1565)